jgi:Na+/proline symporter
MDTGLNKNAGIFIRSFYQPLLRPTASERELMVVSRSATIFFGSMTVLAAFVLNALPGLSLFQIMQSMVSLIAMPVAVPLMLGMFVRRTPPWSGWSTVVVCFLTSLVVANLTPLFGPDALRRLLAFDTPLATWETPMLTFGVGVIANTVVGTLWFLGTSYWYGRQSPAYHASVDAFFEKQKTPIDHATEIGAATDTSQLRTLGRLCLCYGAFVLVLVLIPNPPLGRACFVFIGCAIGGIGALLLRAAKRRAAAGVA